MAEQICFRCFRKKGDYEVCPYCGYEEETKAKEAYQLEPGTVLKGRYIVGTCVGFGGFGITYRAYDTVLGILTAIKELYPAGLVNRGDGEKQIGIFPGKEEEYAGQFARFMEEAKNMALFSREPDFVNVFDCFEENKTAYIVMEYVDAPLLRDRLERGRLSQEEACGYLTALLEALSKVHRHGIIHKDISPDNIFLTGEASVKLFDFGAAKFQGTESGRTMSMIVKKGYAPPEQYQSKYDQGAFMDVYAAGAVFYEMVTGEKPMEAPDRTIKDEMVWPGELGITIHPSLERIMKKAMALDPKLRFATAEQFRDAVVRLKKVELPEERKKRIVWTKRVLLGGSAVLATASATVLLLTQTVFSGRGKIDVAEIEETSVEVWLSAADAALGERVEEQLTGSVQKECPKIHLTLKTIAESEYEQAIRDAAAAGTLPDVFCTDALEASEYCEDLSELLGTMELAQYLCLEELQKKEESVRELPTAIQAGVVYVNVEKDDSSPETVTAETLAEKEELVQYADSGTAYASFADPQTPTAWIAGDLSDLDQVKAVTVDRLPPTDFRVCPVLTDGRLTACFRSCYGVKKTEDPNQRTAGMYLLSLLLSDGVQSAAYMDNTEGIPVNRRTYEKYAEYKMTTYLAFLKEYDPAELLPEDGRDMCRILREETGVGK